MHPIDEPNPDENAKRGKEIILVEGGAITLDGIVAKHVVFLNVAVYYHGSPVELSDVIFVECNFIFTNVQPARDLAHAMLAAATINFKNAG